MADPRLPFVGPSSNANGDARYGAKLVLDVQRHVLRVFERDAQHRNLLRRIAVLAKELPADPSKLDELQRLLARMEKVTDSKLEMLRIVSHMVHSLARRRGDGRRPVSASSSSGEPERPRESDGRSSDDDVRGSPSPSPSPPPPPVVRTTPLPRISATVHATLARKRGKPRAKKAEQPKPKRKRTEITKRVRFTQTPDDDDDDDGSSSSSSDSDNDSQPVDSTEPTYCLCSRVSFGSMICCDNDLCPIEWFHFRCVSMTTKPKGKWFCPKCRGLRSNVMKPRKQLNMELEMYNKQKDNSAQTFSTA